MVKVDAGEMTFLHSTTVLSSVFIPDYSSEPRTTPPLLAKDPQIKMAALTFISLLPLVQTPTQNPHIGLIVQGLHCSTVVLILTTPVTNLVVQ